MKWSEYEILKLKELYPNTTNKELAIIFERSLNSIQRKASDLKLNKSKQHISKTWSKVRIGDKSCNWNGGKKINKKGYVLILNKNHPNCDSNGYIFEHRCVIEEYIGRYITEEEIVHHKNGIKNDNRIENLQLMLKSEHTKLHHIGSKRSSKTRNLMSTKAKERLQNKEKHPLYKNIDINKIEKMLLEGKTKTKISKELNITYATLLKKIREGN